MTYSNPGTTVTTAVEVVLPGPVEPAGLQVRERALPGPTAGQALVRVEASGVSFAEQAMRRGRYPGAPKFPFVPGYDLVGTVTDVGADVAPALVGQRVAALTKSGGWASHALLTAADLVPVPDGVDPAEAETLVVNGITAWQMLHRKARARAGQTILVHGASGGVGTILVQLARDAGIRVIGTASPRNHQALSELGAEPLDYHDADLADQVRKLAPNGVDAVFDNLGGSSFERSFDQLTHGGTLVGYGTASQLEDTNNMVLTFVGILAQFGVWSLLPNRRRAVFYNFWAGKSVRPAAFRKRLAADLTSVMTLLEQGAISPHIAARFPLREANQALTLAESKTIYGKIVLVP